MATSVNTQKLKLYSYWTSSCSCRVRIALNLKGISYEYVAVNLVEGEQFSPEFLKLNPIGYAPVLVDGNFVVSDSFAILMYLEEKFPQIPLLPADLHKRAINYQVYKLKPVEAQTNKKSMLTAHADFTQLSKAANIVSSSIQPLQNQAVLKFIEQKVSPDEKIPWLQYHIGKGFAALEKLLKDHAGRYATGDKVFLADLFLAPQIHGAMKRFNIDMSQFPLLQRLHEAYSALPAFQDAMPENQPDTPPNVS